MADWAPNLDLQQAGNPTPGQPMNIVPPAADPAAGAGWKQGIKDVAGVIGKAAGNFQITDGKVGQRPQPGAAPGNDMAARALALMKRGVISAAQYAQMVGQQQPMDPNVATQMAPPSMAPTHAPSVGGQPPVAYAPPAPPLGPTSPAWNQ